MCPLCERKLITKLYYEDGDLWVVDCKTCGVPMVVMKGHSTFIADEDYSYMMHKIQEIFGETGYIVDSEMRTIPEHYHVHLREEYR